MHRTKGITFQHIRAYCDERIGASAFDEVLRLLSSEDRTAIDAIIAVGWYDVLLYARLLRAFDSVHGKSDLALIDPLSRFEAERDFKTVHRLFFRLASPAYLIEKTTQYWGRFQDTGQWVVERRGSASVQGTLEGWVAEEALCRELSGYMMRAIELVGGHNVVVSHPFCRARGQPACRYLLTWDEKKKGAAIRESKRSSRP